jgi:hypothetical protein
MHNVELLDHLVKAWFAYVATKPKCTDLLKLPTGADLINNPPDPVTHHIEKAMKIVGQQCGFDQTIKHRVCSRNQKHNYHVVEGLIDSAWLD